MPAPVSSSTAARASGLTRSASEIAPAERPSTATKTVVAPAGAAAGSLLEARGLDAAIAKERRGPDEHAPRRRRPPRPAPRRRGRAWPRKPSTGREPSPRSRACATIASPSGCSLPASTAAARSRIGRLVESGDGRHSGDGRRAVRQRAGLVEDDRVDPTCGLERLAAPDQHACLRAPPRADHDRRRRREAHRAWAGDDQDRGEGREREGQLRLGADQEPGHEREGCRDQHERHEDLAHAVGEALDRRLAALGLADQLDDPSERRVPADTRRAQHERAARVQRAADDLVARTHFDGQRLTREHRSVHG